MTTAEIKALVAKPLMKPVNCREKAMFAAIETLLARQAEVLGVLSGPDYTCADDYERGMAALSDDIRAILNPENKT